MSQSERLFYITSVLRERGHFTVKEVSSRFEVAGRTVKRDIEYLRDRCGCEIEYCRERGYYESRGPVPDISPARNMLFYALFSGIARSFNLFPAITDEVKEALLPRPDQSCPDLGDAVRYQFSRQAGFSSAALDELFHSYRTARACIIDYHKPACGTEERAIEPLRFINHDGRWYVLAWCRNSSALRQFALSRVERVTETDKPFINRVSRDSIAKSLDCAFGIMKTSFGADEPVTAKVRFYGSGAERAREQVWHAEQVLEEEDGGSLLLTLPVESYDELVREVLFYGPEAEAVSPAGFREYWLSLISEMSNKFLKK